MTRSGGYAALESPDGGYLYYTKSAGDGQPQSLFRMLAGVGDETRILPAVDWWGNYAVTSKGIYFAPDAKKIQFLDLATGKVSTVALLDKHGAGGLSASPDDAYVVWAQTDRFTMDLMLVEGFR